MARKTGDTNPEHWEHYSNHQHVKHELIRYYLNGWLPKLGRWAGRIQYIDTHAGRGRHDSGELGSPLIALKTLVEHKHRETHFADCEVNFVFIEKDSKNAEFLENGVASFGALPRNIHVEVIKGNCFRELEEIVAYLQQEGRELAPAFVFVDPYGFKLPGKILSDLMVFPHVELFVNVMWRELNMAISQGADPGVAKILDLIFEGDDWHSLIPLDHDQRVEECMDIFRNLTGAKWATRIRMLGRNGATRYILLHLTNHDAGRELMKDCIWKVCPEGGFLARISDDSNQQYMITPEPDLSPLRRWVIEKLEQAPRRWQDLINEIRQELWRTPHLNQVISELRKEGIIEGRDYSSRFTPKNNPELHMLR